MRTQMVNRPNLSLLWISVDKGLKKKFGELANRERNKRLIQKPWRSGWYERISGKVITAAYHLQLMFYFKKDNRGFKEDKYTNAATSVTQGRERSRHLRHQE